MTGLPDETRRDAPAPPAAENMAGAGDRIAAGAGDSPEADAGTAPDHAAQPSASQPEGRAGESPGGAFAGAPPPANLVECGEVSMQTVRYAEDLAALYTVERAQRAELQTVNERLRAVIDSMADGMITVDAAGVAVSVNTAACAMLDHPASAVEGRPLTELLGGPGAAAALPGRGSGMDGARVVELELPSPEGVPRRLARVATSAMRDGGWVLVLHDISMQRRVQHLKQDFLAIISHEMRTPLNGILGLGDVLLDEARRRGDSDAEELLGHLLQAARRMHAMVREVVRFAEVQGGRVDGPDASVDAPVGVYHLLADVLEELTSYAAAHGVVLGPAPAGAAPVTVRGNAGLLRELFMHVLHNAIRFNRKGGMVTLRCRHVRGAGAKSEGLEAGAARTAREVLVEVADTGIGIGAQERERVFESFYQAQGYMTRNREGLGIGLTLARAIARLHGGEVSLTSEVGRGTTVAVRLPASMAVHSTDAQEFAAG